MIPVPPTKSSPVVLVHGLFESSAIWRPLCLRLRRAGIPAATLTLPGHHGDALDYRETRKLLRENALAAHFAERIEEISGGRQVRLIGHSLGGLLSLMVARERPDLVERAMVIATPHAGHSGHHAWFDRRTLADIPLVSHVSAGILLPLWLSDPVRFVTWMQGVCARDEQFQHLPLSMRRDLRAGCPWAIRELVAWLRSQQTLEGLRDVTCPVAVMICAGDPVVTPAHQLELARALPQAVTQIVPCGHVPMLTAPKLLDRAISAWLSHTQETPGMSHRAPSEDIMHHA